MDYYTFQGFLEEMGYHSKLGTPNEIYDKLKRAEKSITLVSNILNPFFYNGSGEVSLLEKAIKEKRIPVKIIAGPEVYVVEEGPTHFPEVTPRNDLLELCKSELQQNPDNLSLYLSHVPQNLQFWLIDDFLIYSGTSESGEDQCPNKTIDVQEPIRLFLEKRIGRAIDATLFERVYSIDRFEKLLVKMDENGEIILPKREPSSEPITPEEVDRIIQAG